MLERIKGWLGTQQVAAAEPASRPAVRPSQPDAPSALRPVDNFTRSAVAADKQPAQPGFLLRHMGADARHWELDLHYFQGQFSAVYPVSAADLEDDRD